MDKYVREIKEYLDSKTTEELQQISMEKNTDQWSEAAFLAIESILNERLALQTKDKSYCHPKDVLCDECGSNNFDYDRSWKEYCCKNCGRILHDKEKLSCLAGQQIKIENAENNIDEKMQQVSPYDTQKTVSMPFAKKIIEGYRWETSHDFYSDYHKSISGKRDLWGWIYGIISPIIFIFLSVSEISELKDIYVYTYGQSIPEDVLKSLYQSAAIANLITVIVCLCFFFGKRWTRKVYYFLPIIRYAVGCIILNGKIELNNTSLLFSAENSYEAICGSIIPLFIYFLATRTVSHRLFFQLHVHDQDIKEFWMRHSNKKANQALWFAVLYPFLIGIVILIFKSKIAAVYPSVSITVMGGFIVSIILLNTWMVIKARKEINLDTAPPIDGKGNIILAIGVTSLWIIAILFLVASVTMNI